MNKTKILDKSILLNDSTSFYGLLTLLAGITSICYGIGKSKYELLLLGITLLLVSPILLLAINYIAIDKAQNKIRIYKYYLLFTVGKWTSFSEYTSVSLYFYISAPTVGGTVIQYETQLKYFEVHLTSEEHNDLFIKEFVDLESAQSFQLLISNETGLRLVEEPIRIK